MITVQRVRSLRAADTFPFRLHLFRSDAGTICGWFIGPLAFSENGIDLPYLPKSANTLAALAIVRAVGAAKAAGVSLCVIDPDNLWSLLQQFM